MSLKAMDLIVCLELLGAGDRPAARRGVDVVLQRVGIGGFQFCQCPVAQNLGRECVERG